MFRLGYYSEFGLRLRCPTVGVTGAGAGVDSVWEQEKLEARKMLENAAESHTSGARFVRRVLRGHDPETVQLIWLSLRCTTMWAKSKINWD